MANESTKKEVLEEEKEELPFGAQTIQETISKNINWNQGAEGIIKKNLLIGNIEGAAQCALKSGRTSEALLLAMIADDQQVFERIKEDYFALQKDPFVQTVIKRIVDEEEEQLVLESSNKNWKEALAYCLSYSKDNVEKLTEQLGDELQKKKDFNSAIVCFILAKKIHKVAFLWKQRVEHMI